MRQPHSRKPLVLAVAAILPLLAGSLAHAATVQEVVVTAARPQPLPAAVSSVDNLAGRQATTSDTAQLLADIPGVSLYTGGGVSSLPAIHGLADDRLRIKIDGMDLISACGNHMNPPLSYIDPSQVGSVKVFAGITPVSVGGDSLGGTILVEAAAPQFAEPGAGTLLKGQAGAFYRSNGNASGANLSATAAGENVSLTYTGATAKSGNYHAAKDFKAGQQAAWGRNWLNGDVVGSSQYKSENQALALAVRHDNHLFEAKYGVQNIPYQGFPNQRMDMTGNDSSHLNLRYKGQYGWGALETKVYQEKTRHKMNYLDDKLFWYGAAHNVPGMPMDTEGKNTGALVKADIILSERDLLRVGGEWQNYRLSDWWSPSGGGMAPLTFKNINQGQRDRIDVFAEWEAQWSQQWQSQLGLRSNTTKTDSGTVQGYNTTMGQYAAESAVFNGKSRQRTDHNIDLTALARYVPAASASYEFGYARKSRSPNLYERYSWSTGSMAMLMNNFVGDGNGYVGDTNLKPEVAHTLSATADWHDAGRERWNIKATPYFTYITDFIDARRCSSANSNCGAANQTATTGFTFLQYANQSARIHGIDLSGAMPLASGSSYGSFNLKGVLNYARGKNQTTHDNLYNLMPLNLRVAVVHQLGGWTNTLESQFVSAKDQVSAVRNEVKTGGYSLINLRSSYEWQKLRLDVGIDNLFNKFYNLPLGGAYVGQGSTMMAMGTPWGVAVPGMGRSLYTGLNVKF